MKSEDWDYIANNWASKDETIMEKIAEIKKNDAELAAEKEAHIAQYKGKVDEYERENRELHNTNMSLILRLTDPSNPENQAPKVADAPPVLKTTDYDKFWSRG